MREGNPLAAWLLTVHPLAFAAAGVPYLLVVAGAVLAAPRQLAVLVAAGVAAVHACAVGAWCLVLSRHPLPLLAAVGLALPALGAVAWWFDRERAEPRSADEPPAAGRTVGGAITNRGRALPTSASKPRPPASSASPRRPGRGP